MVASVVFVTSLLIIRYQLLGSKRIQKKSHTLRLRSSTAGGAAGVGALIKHGEHGQLRKGTGRPPQPGTAHVKYFSPRLPSYVFEVRNLQYTYCTHTNLQFTYFTHS